MKTNIVYIWRYTINEGECGGIVFADTKENAENKIKAKYKNKFSSDPDTDLIVWRMKDDDFFDPENPDVLECYGI